MARRKSACPLLPAGFLWLWLTIGPAPCFAADYYVATDGSDTSHTGRSLADPFRTISRAASVAGPGDTVWIRGGVYRETVTPANSGAPGLPVVFRAFHLERVIVSGADPVTGWTPYSGSIYRATVSLPVDGYADSGFLANQVFVNGRMMTEARWPNTGGDLMRPALGGGSVNHLSGLNAQVVNPGLPAIPEGWAGATVWANEWYISRTGTITGGSGTSLDAVMSGVWERNAYWFYLTGKLGLLDAPSEWHYDGAASALYLWSPDGGLPSGVEAKRRNVGFDLSGRSHIHLLDLSLFACTIVSDSSSRNLLIDHLDARYVSHHVTLPPLNGSLEASHAHDTGIQLRGHGHVLRNSTIAFSSGNGVLLEGSDHLVDRNTIHTVNYQSTFASAIRLNGSGHRILRNTLYNSGRDLVTGDFHTAGYLLPGMEIAYNDISAWGALSSDLGAVYFASSLDLSGGRIHHNVFHDPFGYSVFWDVAGIYTDNDSFNATVDHNLFFNFFVSIPRGLKISEKPAAGGIERIYHNTSLPPSNLPEVTGDIRNNALLGNTGLVGSEASDNLFSGTDPRFDNPDSGAFGLAEGSPAIDVGALIPGFNDDFAGVAPDLGAFERGVSAWTAGVSSTHRLSAPPVITSPPGVAANPIVLPDSADLSLAASDPEGLPVSFRWSKLSGPGEVTFAPNGAPASQQTTASFSTAGYYVLQVCATDGHDDTLTTVDVYARAQDPNVMPPPPAPESIWPVSKSGTDSGPEGNPYELGTIFTPAAPGTVTHLRVFAVAGDSGTHTARLWRNGDNTLIAGPFPWTYGGSPGWLQLDIPDVALDAGTAYTVAVSTGEGGRNYPIIANDLPAPGNNGGSLVYPANAGVFSTSPGQRPTASFSSANYLRDIVFQPDDPGPTFSGWAQRHGLPSDKTGLGAPGASPAGDGIANLLKYALGIDPWRQGYQERLRSTLHEVGPDRYLSLEVTLPEPAPADVLYRPLGSGDLLTWPDAAIEAQRVLNGDGTQSVRWRDSLPVDATGRRFLKLQIQQNP